MLQCNLGYTAEQAGWVFFVFPLGAAAITPILGNFLDHRGKGATMLIFGALLMIACHLVFALVLPALKGTTAAVIVAYLSIILLGISFSLVPASLWPSVPKLVDNKLLGSAYAVIFLDSKHRIICIPHDYRCSIENLESRHNRSVTIQLYNPYAYICKFRCVGSSLRVMVKS